jgi:2-keto-4-pentenoate hydratase/2-oxohepta-3-ene-1,7-dioic acid hydratase in catechol pathway
MKLLRFGPSGNEKPGLLDEYGNIRDLSQVILDVNGSNLCPDALNRLQDMDTDSLPQVEGTSRLGSCIATPGKFIGIGLNYRDHAKEAGLPIPGEPIVFMKTDTCMCGPNDDVMQPRDCIKMDWEVEIAIVIGTTARDISEEDAATHIAGYCIVNDVSERSFQFDRSCGQWDKGKGCDTFGPTGPWLVTTDEIGDVHQLAMWLDVNGERMQSGNTQTMIFNCYQVVSYLSRFMTLQPGDIIATGTPPGVGMGMKPQRWLQPGDTVRLGIDGLGEQCQRIVAYQT